jgi:hypothetical protein
MLPVCLWDWRGVFCPACDIVELKKYLLLFSVQIRAPPELYGMVTITRPHQLVLFNSRNCF